MARKRRELKYPATNGTQSTATIATNEASDIPSYAELSLLQTFMARQVEQMGRYGLQYQGHRDLVKTLGYLQTPSFENFLVYSRRGIGARIVEIVPTDTWSTPPLVQETDEPGDITPFEQDWAQVLRDHDIWGYCRDLDILAQVGEYAVLLVGLEGVLNYAAPVAGQSRARGPESLRYLRVYNQRNGEVISFVEDQTNKRYGLPLQYRMETKEQSTSGVSFTDQFEVHYSHVVHFADRVRETRVFGEPLLLRVIDDIFNLQKTMGGLGEMTWRDGKRRILAEVQDGYRNRPGSPEDQKVKQQLAAFANDFADFLRLEGHNVSVAQGAVPSLEGNILRQMQMIAGELDIPMRRLFGSEQGQLATEEDTRQYNTKLMTRMGTVCIPRILRPLIDLLISAGVLRPPGPEGYMVTPPDLLALTAPERAEIDRKYAQNIRDLVGPMGDPRELVSVEEQRAHGLSQWQLDPEPPDVPLGAEVDEDIGDDGD